MVNGKGFDIVIIQSAGIEGFAPHAADAFPVDVTIFTPRLVPFNEKFFHGSATVRARIENTVICKNHRFSL
jgi:hypothetical protein